jgi:hypothetical protein
MKKTLIILLSCLSLTSLAQSDFSEGFKVGFGEGYKDVKGDHYHPPHAPSPPSPPAYKNSYTDGYNTGFKAGMKEAKGSSSGSSAGGDDIDWYEMGRQSGGGGSNSQAVQQKSSSGQDDLNKAMANYQAKLDQLKAETQGWEKINDIRWTYTYFGHKFWGMEKRKKKAVEKIDEEALIRGFNYEVITFIEHRAKIGVEPKVIVVIELVN